MPGDEPPILPRNRTCPQCDYDRTGLQDGRPCPECGFEIEAGTLLVKAWRTQSRRFGCLVQLLVWVIAIVMMAGVARLLIGFGVNVPRPAFIIAAIVVVLVVKRLVERTGLRLSPKPDYWLTIGRTGMRLGTDYQHRGQVIQWSSFRSARIQRVRRRLFRLKFESNDPSMKWHWKIISFFFEGDEQFANDLRATLSRLIK